MDPGVWGPFFWKTFHYVCLGYPDVPSDSDKKKYADWLNNFHYIIPCEQCSVSFKKIQQAYPFKGDILSCRQKIYAHSVFLHNKVNAKLGKPVFSDKRALNSFDSTGYLHGRVFQLNFMIIGILIVLCFIKFN